MDKFTKLEGVAALLQMINVDTDMIIPKQYLRPSSARGAAAFFRRSASRMTARTRTSCSTSRLIAAKIPSRAIPAAAPRAARAVGADGLWHPLRDLRHSATSSQQLLEWRAAGEGLARGPEKLFDDAERGANATLRST
jgi:3-isopropylmalate/(R)-2-methylmalate dehydratase small subunit